MIMLRWSSIGMSGLASCQPICRVLVELAQPCLLNSGTQSLNIQLPRLTRKCRVRCCSSREVQRFGRAEAPIKSWSYSPLTGSADVEESHHDRSHGRGIEFDTASSFLYTVEPAIVGQTAQNAEHITVGRNGVHERLPTSSRDETIVFGNEEPSIIGMELELLQSRGKPPVIDEVPTEAMTGNLHGLREGLKENEYSPEIKLTKAEHAYTANSYFRFLMEEAAMKNLKGISFGSLEPSQNNTEHSSQNGPSTVNPTSSNLNVNIAEESISSVVQQDAKYYVPKIGDEVIGVVVSGNDHKLDVDIGSAQLGRMLPKDAYPLDKFRSDDIFWEPPEASGSETLLPLYQVRLVRYNGALKRTSKMEAILEVGSVLSLQVTGVSLSGRPLLSARKSASRIAWQRVRQGLRAVLPRSQFLFSTMPSALKDLVGEQTFVCIKEVDEAAGKLILSEKQAWALKNLQLGSLVTGTVLRIFPYGIEVQLFGTSLRAMVHISNISAYHVENVRSVFSVGEKVKAVVVQSPVHSRIALSTAALETSAGLILQDKERVFRAAEEMASHYQSNLPDPNTNEVNHFDIDEPNVANLDWLDFWATVTNHPGVVLV